MSTWFKQQALLDAPVEQVWELLCDPARFPEWAGEAISVTGVPTRIERGSTYEQTSRGPLGTKPSTTFKFEELDELREVKLRCQTSGYYTHWFLTEAQGNTFTELEIGMEPIGLTGRALDAARSKRYFRRAADLSLDGLRRLLRRG